MYLPHMTIEVKLHRIIKPIFEASGLITLRICILRYFWIIKCVLTNSAITRQFRS